MNLYDFIFCDDIRYEKDNKLSLMGLYNDRIIIKSNSKQDLLWPIPMTLALMLRFQINEEDSKPNKFEIEYFIDEKSIAKIQGDMQIPAAIFNLPIKHQGLPIQPGNFGFTVNLFKQDEVLFSFSQKAAIKILYQPVEK